MYFLCIIVSLFASLFVIMERMGIGIEHIATKGHTKGFMHQDSESQKCTQLLGMYAMSVATESDELRMRQRIRRRLDRWLQSYSEELQEDSMQWKGVEWTWSSRFKRMKYETRMLAGLSATVVIMVAHVTTITWILINENTFTYRIMPPLCISVLNVLVPTLFKAIVNAEKHIRTTDQLKQLMFRIYAFKIVQLGVILYSLAKISSASAGSVYENRASEQHCPEAQFGHTFLRLTCTDALVFILTQYFWLFAVNHGIPLPNWWSVVYSFQSKSDQARRKVLLSWWWRNFLCCNVRPEELKLVPGRVPGTEWEIKESTNSAGGPYSFVNIWTGVVYENSKPRGMPSEVEAALNKKYRLQKRKWKPPSLTLEQRLRGEHREKVHVQWWKKRLQVSHSNGAGDDIIVSFDPAHGYEGPMSIEFDYTSMNGASAGCCRAMCSFDSHEFSGPTVKRIDSQGDFDGQLENLVPGMILKKINEDWDGLLQDMSVRQVVELLDDSSQKVTLRFEPVAVVQQMEDWATSTVMQHLTGGIVKNSELDMLAQLLIDAGFATKDDIHHLRQLTPKKLYHTIKHRRGRHVYHYQHKGHQKAAENLYAAHLLAMKGDNSVDSDDETENAVLVRGKRYATVMVMLSVEPVCQMCNKTVAACNLQGQTTPKFCKPCAKTKLENIASARQINKSLFYKFDTEGDDGADKELDPNEVELLAKKLGISDFRGLGAEGLDGDLSGKVSFTEFERWWNIRQKRDALEARAKDCGVDDEQIGADAWRAMSNAQKLELDDQLIDLIVQQAGKNDRQTVGNDGCPRPIACDQPCYFVLNNRTSHHPELSYVLPKVGPKPAFEGLGVARLNAKTLVALFKAMGVSLPGLDTGFIKQAFEEMEAVGLVQAGKGVEMLAMMEGAGSAKDEERDVSFEAFEEWWQKKGAAQVLSKQSKATGRVSLLSLKTVICQPTGSTFTIKIDATDQRFTIAVNRAAETMLIEAADPDHPLWTQLLPEAVPDQVLSVNWGPEMQEATDKLMQTQLDTGVSNLGSNRLRNLSSLQRRARRIREAEKHVRAAFDYSNGSAQANQTVLRELFDIFDRDKSGKLDIDEVRLLLKQLRQPGEIGDMDVKVKKSELAKIMKQMEDTIGTNDRRDNLIDYNEFSAWWEKRVTDRIEKSLVQEHWSEMRIHASAEFAKANKIYNELEEGLKKHLQELVVKASEASSVYMEVGTSKSLGSELSAEADVEVLFKQYSTQGKKQQFLDYSGAKVLLQHMRIQSNDLKDRHNVFEEEQIDRMWDRMDRKKHGTKVETVDWAAFCKWWEGRVSHHQTVGQPSEYWVIEGAARADELEDQRVELGVMEISDLRQRVAEVGAGDEAQLVIDEVVLAIEKREIITWCQKAEDHMSTKTNDAAPKKKAVNQTKALRCYEAALRLDESNPRLQHKVNVLIRQFNGISKKLTKEQIKVFATQLIKYEGQWEEVTAEVNQQRLWKPECQKLDAKESANLLTSIIARQAYVWVGSTWCPWLPVVAVFMQICMFWSLSNAMMGIKLFNFAPRSAYIGGGSEFSADETKRTFMSLSLVALLVSTVPILIWVNQEPVCGPHSADSYEDDDGNVIEGTSAAVFETFSVYLQWLEARSIEGGDSHFFTNEISVIAGFFFNPPVLIIIICVLWTRFRFYKANYRLLQKELAEASNASQLEKKNFSHQHKKLIKQQVQTQCKYGDRTREHLAGGFVVRTAEEVATKKALRDADRRKSEQVLAQQLQQQHDTNQLSRVFEETDAVLRKAIGTSRLLKGVVKFNNLSASQSVLELSSSLQDAKEANKLICMSSLFIGNINADFATEPELVKMMNGWTAENAVLACTVVRMSNSKAEAGPGDYPFPSWAIVTFVTQANSKKVRGKMGALPPFDLQFQNTRGSWHALPWDVAQTNFPDILGGVGGVLSVSDVDAAALVDDSSVVAQHNAKLRRALKDGDVLFQSGAPETSQASVDDEITLAPYTTVEQLLDVSNSSDGRKKCKKGATVDNPMFAEIVIADEEEEDDTMEMNVQSIADSKKVAKKAKKAAKQRKAAKQKKAKREPGQPLLNPMFEFVEGVPEEEDDSGATD